MPDSSLDGRLGARACCIDASNEKRLEKLSWYVEEADTSSLNKRASADAWLIAGSGVIIEMIDRIVDAIEKYGIKGSPPPPSTKPPCYEEPFALAGEGYDFKIDVRNGGAECTTMAIQTTIYDGVRDIIQDMSDRKCKRCCAIMDHEGKWKAEIALTSDGTPAQFLDCSVGERYSCKANESGKPYCDLMRDGHDEL